MAMVLDAFVSQFVQLLYSYGKEDTASTFGVSEEIKILRRKLVLIQRFLADAESRWLGDIVAVKQWLDELKDIMYDAEDIIEEYKTEAEQYIEEGSNSSSLVNIFGQANSNNNIPEKMKDLNRRLDDINEDIKALGLVQTPTKECNQRRISQTTSSIEEPDIVGSAIQDAAKEMVELLIKEESNNNKNILIYAIVGMGGIGKTTLAQKICNDEILLTNFHPVKPIWICISKDNVNEINILKSIISTLGGNLSNFNERGQLEQQLYELVTGKRLFLVLDDIWDAQLWEDLLRKPLSRVGIGSRVLLTTRYDYVAKEIGAKHRHSVAKLSDEDGWSLLCKKVFNDGEEEEMHAFKEKGIKIVKKCDGLPIAINAVAGVLKTKELTKSEWDKILRSPMWSLTNVVQAFYLSYEDLPSHLKQCFLYFSLFPEDENLVRDFITRLWIAEGFVKSKDNKMLEETADEYWNELIQRNLLQVIYPTTLTCRIHDLLLKFAQDLMQGECFCGDVKGFNEYVMKTKKKVRRWYVPCPDEVSFHAINKHISLRTIIGDFGDFTRKGSTEHFDDGFKLLKRIRILKLVLVNLKRLPSSFVDLRYLRYLHLSGGGLEELPESIKSLKNLQFLFLDDCYHLQSLPKAIGFLTNLRYLDFRRIFKMPKEMVKLQQLRNLKFSIPKSSRDGDTWYLTLEDVKHFEELRELSLYNTERISGAAEARAATLADKTLLTRLRLEIEEEKYDGETIRIITEAYEELCPPTCIEELYIRGYYGITFPSWLMRPSSLMNLRILSLANCPYCEEPPPLGQLPQLTELYIYEMGLRRVGVEFLLPNTRDTSQHSFPKLEILCFEDLFNWEEWEDWAEENEDQNLQKKIVLFPRLKELKIDGCFKLRYLPRLLLNHATALTKLFIKGAYKLEVVENLHHIKTLKIDSCRNLKRVTNLSSLKTLDFRYCKNLTNMEYLPELQLLTISWTSMKSLPVLEHLPKLHKLSISEGKYNMLLRCRMEGEEWLKIRDIPQFEFRDAHGLFIKYTKSPFSYDTNINSIESKDEGLPEQVNNSSLHYHPLILLPSIDYYCFKCHKKGKGWLFSCVDCYYNFHPNCVLQELEENIKEEDDTSINREMEMSEPGETSQKYIEDKVVCLNLEEQKNETDKKLQEFSYSDLELATSGFSESNELGQGGFGKVYKGNLRGDEVAIKILLNPADLDLQKAFNQEVNILCNLNHPHIVRLIGACPEEYALVYEFIPGGTLEDRLSKKDLPWQDRIRIATEICNALVYLHSPKPNFVVHSDLKPENVLLDGNGKVKLADFGISRSIPFSNTSTTAHVTTASVQGSSGYMDPLLPQSCRRTPSNDVYAFGMVLLRLLTNKKAGIALIGEVEGAMENQRLDELLDSAAKWPSHLAEELTTLAKRCCSFVKGGRPNLADEVCKKLEQMKEESSAFRL